MRDLPWVHLGVAATAIAIAVVVFVVEDTDIRVGLFGLLGTLTGALATFEGTQLAGSRDARARRRAAGRLLQEDLLFAQTRCQNAIHNKLFWAPRLDLRLDGWAQYRETVSKDLDRPEDWQIVASAFEAMRSVQSKCDALRKESGDRPEIGPHRRRVIDVYLERSGPAIDALRALSGDRPDDEELVPDAGM